jgi:hypothetical protein
MTMKQPRFSGPHPIVREAVKKDRACTIAIQALCRGELDWRVQGVTGAAARKAQPTSRCATRFASHVLPAQK